MFGKSLTLETTSLGNRTENRTETPKSNLSLSKLEMNLRNRKLISEESVENLINLLEFQLQRLDLSISFDKSYNDPVARILEVVKNSIDEILKVKESCNMNSFISHHGENENSIVFAELNAKVTAEKLNAANTQLKHFERLLKKKEKLIIQREKEVNIQKEIIEKSKEQIEISKLRLKDLEGKGEIVHIVSPRFEDAENIKALAMRLTKEKESIEIDRLKNDEESKRIQKKFKNLEKKKQDVTNLIDENKRLLEVIDEEKNEILETKEFIENKKEELLDIKKRNNELMDYISKARIKIKSEEEELTKKRIEVESIITNFQIQKKEFANSVSEFEKEKNLLIEEREILQRTKMEISDQRKLIEKEFNNIEELKKEIKYQSNLELQNKKDELIYREKEINNSIMDLQEQVELFNKQIQEKENDYNLKEDRFQDKEKQLKNHFTNLKLIEMSLVESKNQCLEMKTNLIPQIENCYVELQEILQVSYQNKNELEKLLQMTDGYPNLETKSDDKLKDSDNEKKIEISSISVVELKNNAIEELTAELQLKIQELNEKQEDLNNEHLKNIEDADNLNKLKKEFNQSKLLFENEIKSEREKLKKNFSQLENSLKMIKNKEEELSGTRKQLQEKENLLYLWENNLKEREAEQ